MLSENYGWGKMVPHALVCLGWHDISYVTLEAFRNYVFFYVYYVVIDIKWMWCYILNVWYVIVHVLVDEYVMSIYRMHACFYLSIKC
jgi:hypothetical protein